MGGIGSTRWGSHKKKMPVEYCEALTIKDVFQQAGKEKKHEDRPFMIRKDEAEIETVPVENLFGIRWRLRCPICHRLADCVYRPLKRDIWGCLKCHDLTYLSAQTAHLKSAAEWLAHPLLEKCFGEEYKKKLTEMVNNLGPEEDLFVALTARKIIYFARFAYNVDELCEDRKTVSS